MAGFTQAQLEALEKAIAQGALRVKYADKEVTYRSLEEMIQLRGLMKKDLGQGSSKLGFYPKHSKRLGRG